VGARGDLTKEQKASYLLHKLKGAAKKEVENIEDLDDIWDALECRFNRPALYAREAMKSLVGWRPIPFNDLSGLAKYYSLVLTTRRELSQYGQEREMETYGMLHEMVSKLPLMEKNEYIKSRREDSPLEFFAFVKKRQVEVAELDCEQMAGSNQKYFNKGAASGASGGNGGSTGGSTSGGGSGSSYSQFKKSNNDGKSHNNTKQGTANVAAGKQNATNQMNYKQKAFVCAMGCGSLDFHFLDQCRSFLMLSVEQRVKFVEENNLCRVCLGPGQHPLAECKFFKKSKGCAFCKGSHSWCLHSSLSIKTSGGNGIALSIQQESSQSSMEKVMMLIQKVLVADRFDCCLLWDSVSTVNLIRNDYAKSIGAVGKPVKLVLTVAGGEKQNFETFL
jgi:hypothetical protein